MMEQNLKCKIQTITFVSKDGYGVYKAQDLSTGKQITLTGNWLNLKKDDTINITNHDEVIHKKYGKQYRINNCSIEIPTDSILQYITNRIKGIGPATAKKIFDKFGDKSIDIIENSPDSLIDIKGITQKKLAIIKASGKDEKAFKELSLSLLAIGVTPQKIKKLWETYGTFTLSYLKINPYGACYEIPGIGFKLADKIAIAIGGLALDDEKRLNVGLCRVLDDIINSSGHIGAEKNELLRKASKELQVQPIFVEDILKRLIKEQEMFQETIQEKEIIIHKDLFLCEKKIARLLVEHLDAPPDYYIKPDIEKTQKVLGIEFADSQKLAIDTVFKNKITVITGGPGTGKSTITKAITYLGMDSSFDVLLAAPTGKAAKRLSECTGMVATTIHRLLNVDPITGQFSFNEDVKLICDLLIIDEMSMVDIRLFNAIVKALPKNALLVLVGDKNQLAPVGPGAVLIDLIASSLIKVVKLERNYRQDNESKIIDIAHQINSGKMISLDNTPDFEFIDIDGINLPDDHKFQDVIKYCIEEFNISPGDTNFQILAPMYDGPGGINLLNNIVQEQYNLSGITVETRGNAQFKTGDKVLCVKNNSKYNLVNGDQGIIMGPKIDVPAGDDTVASIPIMFDDKEEQLLIDEETFETIRLSYAVSIHKSQGSEYNVVILFLMPNHRIMLCRELLYTAVTRTKKNLVIVSTPETIRMAIANSKPSNRITLLTRRLDEELFP